MVCLLTGFMGRANQLFVTTTANEGAGSLRNAIQLAASNGILEKDSILFTINGSELAAFTIHLYTELPPLSSNLMIDGSRNSGVFVPLINAGIILNFLGPLSFNRFHFLRIQDATDISITGLVFQNLLGPFQFELAVAGIQLTNARRIQIGAEGKGNLFSGALISLVNETRNNIPAGTIENLSVEGNLFGLSVQLEKTANNGIYLARSNQLRFRKNMFVNSILHLVEEENSTDFFVEFSNNRSNNIDGQPISDGSFLLKLDGAENSSASSIIEYNFLHGTDRLLELNNLKHPVQISGNALLSSSTRPCSPVRLAISLNNCKQVTIGTPEGEGTNAIFGSIWQNGAGKTAIWQNQLLGEIHLPAGTTTSTNTITYYFENILRGKAEPGAIVQLYGTNCADPCPLRTYINSATADEDGNWMISHNFLAGAYFLTSTRNGQSGEFQDMALDPSSKILYNDIKITDDTCHTGSGALEISNPAINLNSLLLEWKTENGELAGNGKTITGLSSGNYYLESSKGGAGCPTQIGPFAVKAIDIAFPPTETREIWTEANSKLDLLLESDFGTTFFLFDQPGNSAIPIDSSATGQFKLNIGSVDRTYYVRMQKGTCRSNSNTYQIRIRKAAGLYFPTAFSPNKDGRNDQWRPVTNDSFEKYKLQIYNRLGQIVFETRNAEQGWDGNLRGLKQGAGIYTWTLEALDRTNVQIRKRGQFLLLR
jgi:gliding motility-associated-like protein